jgi:hypothetical protein
MSLPCTVSVSWRALQQHSLALLQRLDLLRKEGNVITKSVDDFYVNLQCAQCEEEFPLEDCGHLVLEGGQFEIVDVLPQ